MLFVPQVVVALGIVVAALLGKGSRLSFFGWAVAATLRRTFSVEKGREVASAWLAEALRTGFIQVE